jgi:hypothetical protein|tara:strand:+ start:4049 stop:4345 length:297 start_codon:yes stop_codon:yes gene_type:complete
MFVNIIKTYREVVAICDADLLGKKFEEGMFQLDVKENFFKGEKCSEEEVINIIKSKSIDDATFNIIGEKSVNTALKAGIISKDQIKKIQGIPFILILI